MHLAADLRARRLAQTDDDQGQGRRTPKGKPWSAPPSPSSSAGRLNRKLSTKTDKRGEFIQLLTESGNYRVTATDDKLGTATAELRVRLGRVSEVNIGARAGNRRQHDAKAAELKKTFDEGVAASRAGNHDAAIEKFKAALALQPSCHECYFNIGVRLPAEEGREAGRRGVEEGARAEARLRRGAERAGHALQQPEAVRRSRRP